MIEVAAALYAWAFVGAILFPIAANDGEIESTWLHVLLSLPILPAVMLGTAIDALWGDRP